MPVATQNTFLSSLKGNLLFCSSVEVALLTWSSHLAPDYVCHLTYFSKNINGQNLSHTTSFFCFCSQMSSKSDCTRSVYMRACHVWRADKKELCTPGVTRRPGIVFPLFASSLLWNSILSLLRSAPSLHSFWQDLQKHPGFPVFRPR